MIFEKIRERLKKAESVKCYGSRNSGNYMIPLADAIIIVEQAETEYNNGWIPCSERLPSERDWYLAVFEETETGFVGLPYIADYLMGQHTKYTTEDGWIIANCTDIEEDRSEYYKKLKCIAWQPLPEPYTPKGE